MKRSLPARWRILVWLGAAAALLLPVTSHPSGRLAEYLLDLVHVPLFALLTFTVWNRRPRWKVLGGMALVILLVELVQPTLGREAESGDAWLGLAGVGIALAFHASARDARSGAWRALGAAILAAALFPLAPLGLDRYEAGRAFPLLASFRSRLETGRWRGRGCRLARARTPSGWSLQVEVSGASEYPGAFLVEAPRDWSRMEELCVTLYWPGPGRRELFWLRADDRPDAPSYAERVQTAFTLEPGVNRLVVRRSDWAATPSGRPFHFGHVVSLGLFFGEAERGERVDIQAVRLHLETPPAPEKH